MKEFVCKQCGNFFETKANHATYCPECRAKRQVDRARAYREKINSGQFDDIKSIGSPQVCPECGNTFEIKSASQKVCENCAKKYRNKSKSKANAKYSAKAYDDCHFYVKKGIKEQLQVFAANHNMSFNELVNNAISMYTEALIKNDNEQK